MKFVWGKTTNQLNQRLEFTINLEKNCDTLVVCAVDFYQVYLDGNLTSYGPSRTASGYARKRIIPLNEVKTVTIKTASYGVRCYSCDLQAPFFSAEILNKGKVVYKTQDFTCRENSSVVVDVPKYSGQRGFIEYFDLTNPQLKQVETYTVKSPKILNAGEDFADYLKLRFEKTVDGEFNGFSDYNKSELTCDRIESSFNVKQEIIEKNWSGYKYQDYELKAERTGFFTLKGNSDIETELTIFFEETLVDGKWCFRRSGCNDFFKVKLPKGEFSITTFEPYSSKILKVVGKVIPKDLEIGMITLENKNARLPKELGDEKLNLILKSALSTFRQNAVDIFTDCPSRERAGWLCDSYFLGLAEDFFCNNNNVEKNFIENYTLSKTPEIPKGMLPKCFPSEHPENPYNFIPNWALWFILELKNYYDRTKDLKLVKKSKKKVYELLKYFNNYENEYGLLENLDGWIFVEWSDCNNPDHVDGVNFPTNMLYAYALECVGKLYSDKKQTQKSKNIKTQIKSLSFDGEFFCDNAIRVDDKLQPCLNNLTETCQYYALFFGIDVDENFERKMIEDFGPNRTKDYPNVSKSNVFIGYYLRYLWLLTKNQNQRILNECKDYFYNMAERTGTLWEHDTTEASCNHGFSSVIAKIIYSCYE